MKITKHKELIQLSFMPRLFPVNCYLIELERELMLIDAALPFSVKGILKAVKQFGKPLSTVLLTHAHNDHIGALDGLKEAVPGISIGISERDSRLLAGDRSLDPQERQTPIRGGVPSGVTSRPDLLLRDGDRIGPLLAVSCPGHTPGSMAFLDERNGSLIAGDAFQLRGGIAVSGQLQPWFPFPALATWSPEEALLSARKLIECRPSVLAVGHGSLLHHPLEAMTRAAEKAGQKLQGKGGNPGA
ncbi:MBL fold metallo-hydrolase [Paenibacillus pinistramenti]|uniref:MBL fold metallo-hydrolase n=1 Tax=Paenibacillus pinistramenti TaxID=1768003 RepID=UPI0011088348|nr:MBL fold metallo-hydrolase [Paenibacillus pinistramenti]